MAVVAQSPREVFEHWLEHQASSARVVVACDTDHLLADSKALDKPTVVDPKGRTWQLASYRGDDLRFRLNFRRATQVGRTAVVLVGSGQPDVRLDVSTISDLLSHDESSEPLDLSLARYLGRFCPQINFPPEPLRHYRESLLNRAAELASAAKKITNRWGRPDDWGRAQVAGLVLLAEAPTLSLDDLWPDLESPAAFAAHAVRLLVARPELKQVGSTTRDFLRGYLSAVPSLAHLLPWCEPEADELAAFLVLRAFAAQHRLQNPTAQLTGLGLLPVLTNDRTWSEFDSLTREVIDVLQRQGVWPLIETAASDYLTPKRVEKLLSLTGHNLSSGPELADFVALETLLPVRTAVLRRLILQVLAQPAELPMVIAAWHAVKEGGPVEGDLGTKEDAQSAQAMVNLLFVWQRIESTILQPAPVTDQPPALLEAFERDGWHRLDVDLGQLPHLASQSKDDDLIRAVHALTFGEQGDDQRPQVGSLKERVRAAQDRLDHRLAAIVQTSPDAFISGTWCSAYYLRTQLRSTVDQISLGNQDGRVWILVFDGMRFDTWRFVVKPLLSEHFTNLDDRPHFCVPPSFTTVARASLLAGSGPKQWQGFQGQWTGDEFTLAARNFGLTQPEAKAKLRLQKEAETLKARGKLNHPDAEASTVNILIYSISDECHDFYGDFGSFQEKIRHDFLGNSAKGVGGILDDLLRRIGPKDEVVVVSDHGFTELLTGDACVVTAGEATAAGRNLKDDLQWRYAVGFAPKAAGATVPVEFNGEVYHMAVGRKWFCREGTKQPARFSHGGCTLAEMVVPAVRLKRVTSKTARVVLDGLPEQISLSEDSVCELPVQVRNLGTLPVDFVVEARTNLGEILVQASARLPAGEVRPIALRVVGRYRQTPLREVDPSGTLQAVMLRMRHTNVSGVMIEPADGQITVPVQVVPKSTKLDTEALAGLDNL
jgi:hypothetical protein